MKMESKMHLDGYFSLPVLAISSPLAVAQGRSGAEAGRDHPHSVHEVCIPAAGDSYAVTGYHGRIYTPSFLFHICSFRKRNICTDVNPGTRNIHY